MRGLFAKGAVATLLALAGLLIGMSLPGAASANDDLNVEELLKQPGVKLLAVDFYATWCKPCMAAIPKWKVLQEKYRSKGLRLVVVSVQSEGGCAKPEWAPDKIICDAEGSLAKSWQATNLPQAFLWSWQGNLLVKHGHAEDVEAAIEAYFQNVPRILVDEPVDTEGKLLKAKDGDELKRMVRSELVRAAKFELVADEKERAALKEARKKAHAANFDEQTSCHLGEEVSPNSILKIYAGETKLRLELLSLEKGCLTASSYVPANKADYQPAVIEAVYKLINQLTKGDEVATPDQKQAAPVMVVEQARDPDSFKSVNVRVESDPTGAKVYFRGTKVCDSTPCQAEVSEGMGTFILRKDRYEELTQKVDIKPGMEPLKVKLTPLFGWLTVTSEPTGIEVKLLGMSIGKTPITRKELDPGQYRLEVGDIAYKADSKSVQIDRNQESKANFVLNARKGSLKIAAKYEGGDALEGEVFFDGTSLGKTGESFQVLCGEHRVEVKTSKGNASRSVTINEGQDNDIELTVSKPVSYSSSYSRSYSGSSGAGKYFGIGRELKASIFWVGGGAVVMPKASYNFEVVDFTYFGLSGDWAGIGVAVGGLQVAGYDMKDGNKKRTKMSLLPVGAGWRLGRFHMTAKVHVLSLDVSNKFAWYPTFSMDFKFPLWTPMDSGHRRNDVGWVPVPAVFVDTELKNKYKQKPFSKKTTTVGVNLWFGTMMGD